MLLSVLFLLLPTVFCQDTVLITDSSDRAATSNYLKHLNNFLNRLDLYPENFNLQYVPYCEIKNEEGTEPDNICNELTEEKMACTQKYIKGNFLPTVQCIDDITSDIFLEDCVQKTVNCSEQATKTVTLNIKKCINSKEGANLVKKARKSLPSEIQKATNGFINKKPTIFNKPPKELLCKLNSLKDQPACQPCIR